MWRVATSDTLSVPPGMAATLPSRAAGASPLLLHCNAAPSVSFRHRRRWQRPAASRHDGRVAQLLLPVARRWLPAAAPPGVNGARGGIAASGSGAGAAAGEAPYRGNEEQGSLWMVFLATAVVVCGSFCWVCPLQLVNSDRIGLNPTIYLFKWALDWEGPR
jgi:MFS transporter, SP family, ERD6-like sugar transporter